VTKPSPTAPTLPAPEDLSPPAGAPCGGAAAATEPFELGEGASGVRGGVHGEIKTAFRPRDLAAEVRRLIDPAASIESLHWGRNYLYLARLETVAGPVDVVVKQFRGESLKERLSRRFRGTKAARGWRGAQAMVAAGLPTPEPVMMVESERPDGPSFYICRHLSGTIEARYLLRAAREGREGEVFPEVDFPAFLADLGHLIARMHAAGIWHRDVSVGNILLKPRDGEEGGHDLYLLDLNRMRFPGRLSLFQRNRDLSRLALTSPEHQELFLAAYWGEDYDSSRRLLFRLFQGAFELKGKSKRPFRQALGGVFTLLRPRRAHAHIPEAPAGASARDKSVWDPLSDQPHQHAGRFEKLAVRLVDIPAHLESLAVLAAAAPGIYRRYRRLQGDLYRQSVPWGGVGVALRPCPEAPEELLAAVEDLGVGQVLLRLHPWQDEHDAEEELARELAERGCELAFALPQNRDLVKDPERWRRRVAELGRRFVPYGRFFQVGQAINRSKWGIWRNQEYVELARIAGEELRRHEGVEVLGPAVIDFEHHVTATVLNLRRRGLFFDAVSSLLYVDRRGAPENSQMGFDTVAKVVGLRAIAETSRNATGRCWITEVNWPLREGPHSPAGKSVAVSEESQADYLVRYYILCLATGLVERVYWWQLVARGYGLMEPRNGDAKGGELLRRRPSFRALATLARLLAGTTSHGPLGQGRGPAGEGTDAAVAVPEGARLYRFTHPEEGEILVGWSIGSEPLTLTLPRPVRSVVGRGGEVCRLPSGREVELGPSPLYVYLEKAPPEQSHPENGPPENGPPENGTLENG